jgi:hypothetical protein
LLPSFRPFVDRRLASFIFSASKDLFVREMLNALHLPHLDRYESSINSTLRVSVYRFIEFAGDFHECVEVIATRNLMTLNLVP